MLSKEKVQDQLRTLPDTFTLDEIVERLILIDKIEQGLEDSENSRVLSSEEMAKDAKQWFK